MLALIATVGGFLPGLFGKKVSFGVAKVLGFVTLAVLAIGLFFGAKALYDRSVIKDHEAEREAKAAPAREEAADRRLEDQATNTKSEEELHDVITAAPKGGTLSPAAKSLACERLRRNGRIPPACRPESGNGTQTRPN